MLPSAPCHSDVVAVWGPTQRLWALGSSGPACPCGTQRQHACLPPLASSIFPHRVSDSRPIRHPAGLEQTVTGCSCAQEGRDWDEASEVPGMKGKGHSLSSAHLSLHHLKCGTLVPHLPHPSPGLQSRLVGGSPGCQEELNSCE